MLLIPCSCRAHKWNRLWTHLYREETWISKQCTFVCLYRWKRSNCLKVYIKTVHICTHNEAHSVAFKLLGLPSYLMVFDGIHCVNPRPMSRSKNKPPKTYLEPFVLSRQNDLRQLKLCSTEQAYRDSAHSYTVVRSVWSWAKVMLQSKKVQKRQGKSNFLTSRCEILLAQLISCCTTDKTRHNYTALHVQEEETNTNWFTSCYVGNLHWQ